MNAEGAGIIYTIGTGTRSAEEFIELLRSYGVSMVADVRRYPSSRFEHFNRANLAGLLSSGGIGYVFMGDELGGYRPGGYRSFTSTPEFERGVAKLEEIARTGTAAVVCAERLPSRCHRRFIALELERRGWRVEHIVD